MAGLSPIHRLLSVLLLAGLVAGAAVPAARAQPEPEAPSQPRLHVLLVAATDYASPDISDMPSAAADAFLLARILLDRGADASDVRLLTEGAPPDALWPAHQAAQGEATRDDARALSRRGVRPLGAPTRARVLEEMDRMVSIAEAGEQVFIAISGHGEQQRTTDLSQEPDGFDETFLPVDVQLLPDRGIRGVVLDDEIGLRVEALLANGVQVVFVGDFCHSEGGTRGSAARRSGGGRSDVRLLGGAVGTTDIQGRGRFSGIYAAPSLARALALAVPYWAEDANSRRIHGALSFYLAAALQDPSMLTMRDIALRVERDINLHARTVQRLPPPQFEGDFSAPAPGTSRGLATSLWQVSKPESDLTLRSVVELTELVLPAGTLNGVEPGAIYALSQTRDGEEQVILYGRAEDVSATSAFLRPVAAGALSTAAWTDLRREDGRPMIEEEIFTARLYAPGAPETVRIARPVPPEGAPTSAQAEALADIQALVDVQTRGLQAVGSDSSVSLPPYVVLVDPEAPDPSLRLAFEADALVLRDEVENGRILARMDLARALERIRPAGSMSRLSSLRASLAEGLNTAARFQRVRSAASLISDAAIADSVPSFDGLALTVYRYRPDTGGPCSPPWRGGDPVAWVSAEGPPQGTEVVDPVELGSPGGAQECDAFVMEIRNEGSANVARSVLGRRYSADWANPCDRVGAGAGLAALGPEQAYACSQPVSVGVVALSSDSAIRSLTPAGATSAELVSGARRLNRGERARYLYVITEADPDFLLRTDFMVLAARSPFRQEGLPVHFSQLCQRPLQEAFIGPMGPGERNAPDPCLGVQGRFRSARAADGATAPATVDGLFAILSGEAMRGDAAQPVGGTTMRRLTIQVAPRPH